jgi:competence protein ComEC
MQKEAIIWRKSNPIFFICSYLLLGMYCHQAFSAYWPKLAQTSLLYFLFISLLIVGFCSRLDSIKNQLQILPTIVLMLWGYCIAQFNHDVPLLNELIASPWIEASRQYFYNKLDHSFTDAISKEFAKTLLFGTKSNMSAPLKKAYLELGILHIIAISGMHLDILFKLLEKATTLLPSTYWARCMKLITLLFIVWTYTCIAHAGPSVVRASLFFSILLIGRFFYLNLFSFNTISTGILFVLLYNSHILSSIGLQLSYGAVIGIHFFYKPIAQLAPMDNPLLNIAWNNLALSIAAQLTTVPMILYYFHSSSSLSIIGNFLFVPASSLLLYGLLAWMLLPNFGGLLQYYAEGLSLYIEKMNGAIQLLYQMLQLGEHKYQIGIAGLSYYYFCLFVGYYWIQNKAPNCLIILLIGSCLYSLLKLFSI